MTRRIKTMSGAALVAAAATLGCVTLAPQGAWAEKPATSTSPLSRAQAHFNRGDYRSATIELRNALRANPNSVPARLLQARVYLRLNQGLPAQTEVEAARRAGATKDSTRHLMAEALVLQRRFADAPFWTVRRDWPDDAPIHAAPDAAPPEIARRPVLVGQTIEEREVVVTADHPDGVYVIDGVPLVPLLRLAQEANATPALLAENLAAAPVQVEKALAWLRLRGLLPSLTSGAPAP